MAITRIKKSDQLEELEQKFSQAKGVAFVKYDKATVEEVQVVRRSLRAKGMSYTVIKKTLMSIASKKVKNVDFSATDLPGCVAVIISPDDEISPLYSIKEIKKDHFDKKSKFAKFDFAGALFEGEFLNSEAAMQLANTPSREESLRKIMLALSSGTQKIHGVLSSGLRSIHTICKDSEKFQKTS